MSKPPSRKMAAENLAAILDPHLLEDLAPQLTCFEANVLAEFIEVFRSDGVNLAQRFLEVHARGDTDENDLHYLDAEGKVHDRNEDRTNGEEKEGPA